MSIRPLSDALQKKAESELNEVPSQIQENIKHIRDWLEKQPHLKARTDDQWLLGFLRGCKHSLQRTKEKLDFFYTMRTIVPEFFSNRDPLGPDAQETIEKGGYLALPNSPNSSEPRVIIIRPGRLDPDRMTILDYLKTVTMCVDMHLAADDNFIIGGQHLLIDFRNMTYKHFFNMTPNIMKKLTICLLSAYPTRPQGIHFLNAPSLFDAIYNILKPLFSEKLKTRVGFYTDENLSTLHKIIPSASLPKEYGGDASIDEIAGELKKKLESYQEWFREDAAYCSDETKRPGKPRTSEEMFGAYGSFRKLNID